jgi:peptidyl-prolyl cis-trans isomerase SurA
VVAVYADTALTLSAFETAYRNANPQASPREDSLAAYQSFLEQYVNYRLKVRAARAAGLDTLPSVRREVSAYRQELARPRVMKQEIYEPLIRTLYERRQTEVDVSHILLRVGEQASPADTLAAYRSLQSIADSLARGVPFGALAYRNSEDPSAQKKGEQGYRGRLGYLRAGQLVEPFEKRMYAVPPDSVSDIFRTRFGYHILKVHDRRPTQPPIRLSHIMVRPDSAAAPARRTLDSLRTVLRRDSASFSALARQYSEDPRSAARGGDLGTVQSPQALPPSFREALAEMDTVGTVSDIVQSQYGYHLIKLTDRDSLRSYEAAYDDLKEQITGRPRVERRKARFARRMQARAGLSVDTSRILSAVPGRRLDTLARPLLTLLPADSSAGTDDAIAHLGDSTYTLAQLARHVTQTDGGARMTVGDVLSDFLTAKTITYAQATLARRDPAFAAKMREYRDGLLAFQFMQDSVWSVAARDTAALRRTFRRHRDRYRYPERVRTFVLRAAADSLLRPYDSTALRTRSPTAVLADARADSLVRIDTLMVDEQSPAVYQRVWDMADGTASAPIRRKGESRVLVRDTRLPPRRKRFAEALSAVVRDYQEQYEDTVLRRLRRRYDATTYPGRLRPAFAPSSTN